MPCTQTHSLACLPGRLQQQQEITQATQNETNLWDIYSTGEEQPVPGQHSHQQRPLAAKDDLEDILSNVHTVMLQLGSFASTVLAWQIFQAAVQVIKKKLTK